VYGDRPVEHPNYRHLNVECERAVGVKVAGSNGQSGSRPRGGDCVRFTSIWTGTA
jgi:hypothetical protein